MKVSVPHSFEGVLTESGLRIKGVSLSRTFKKSIFFVLFQSMDLLSENIVAKFYSPYQNSFDGRVPSSGLRGVSGRFFSPSENFQARFLKT